MHVRLVNLGPLTLKDFRLALTSVVQLTPRTNGRTKLVARISGWHELAPADGFELPPGAVWDLDPLVCGHRPAHANDGPASAYVVLADGSTRAVTLCGCAPNTGRALTRVFGAQLPHQMPYCREEKRGGLAPSP